MYDTPEAFVEFVRHMAVDTIGPHLGPEDDWHPVAFLRCGNETAIAALEFENDEEKQLAYEVALPLLIEETRATMVATINTAWIAEADGLDVRPANHPNRREGLVIIATDWHGRQASWFGLITRGDHAPRVVMAPESESSERFGGMLSEPAAAALRENAERSGLGRN